MNTIIKQPKITLVGAGPGDPDLITLKGLRAIQKADVILYDALVNEELLNEAPFAKKIFVGKRRGYKALEQTEINSLLVEEAIKNGHAVRLKGGDPFVFGRGYEEIQHAGLFGIPVDVIPGISSSIAVPALAGVPVTHRGTSNSFTVITATLSDGSLNSEVEQLPLLNGTVVVLMGLSKLSEITAVYQKAGKESVPFGVISKGTLPDERTFVGTAKTISGIVAENNVQAPAIIIIGDVVELSSKVHEFVSAVNYN